MLCRATGATWERPVRTQYNSPQQKVIRPIRPDLASFSPPCKVAVGIRGSGVLRGGNRTNTKSDSLVQSQFLCQISETVSSRPCLITVPLVSLGPMDHHSTQGCPRRQQGFLELEEFKTRVGRQHNIKCHVLFQLKTCFIFSASNQ